MQQLNFEYYFTNHHTYQQSNKLYKINKYHYSTATLQQ